MVASVVVPYLVNKRSIEEEADTRTPIVVVGVSAKFPSESAAVSSHVFPNPAPPPPPEPQAEPVAEITPWFDTWTHSVPVFPRPDTVRRDVDAVPCTVRGAPGFPVPIPTLPFASMMNAVLVADAVEVAITNRF